MPTKKKPSQPKTLRITSGLFGMPWGDDPSLRYRMRMDYNDGDGIQTYISKRDGDWVLHSCPFPGKLPRAEVAKFVEIFKRSVRKFDPRIKFKAESI